VTWRQGLGVAALGTCVLLAVGGSGADTPSASPATHDSPRTLQQLLDQAGTDLAFSPLLAAYSCPVERGPVKEGSDADRYKVGSTLSANVAQMRIRPKPSSYPKNNRVTSTELHGWSITAYLKQYKQESDGDIHLVIEDGAGRTMIAELPYGSCVPSTSRWRTQIASARAAFARAYSASTSWKYTHRLMDLHGIGYMDPLHGQTGVAPNGVELHPVTYIYFR
jgi:hypothetical protein